jgi:tetrapyrrole methylase family protein/MazG family protein
MSTNFDELKLLFATLRDPEGGCPWDLKQTPESLREYILEEAHELVEAITDGDPLKQKEELGDVLLQVLFLSRIMEERRQFCVEDVMVTLKEKLIRRHPHIFAEKSQLTDEDVKKNWEKIKKEEKTKESILSQYPDTMPALSVCKRISEQAASVGFDWVNEAQIRAKVDEELLELARAETQEEKFEECGDLLFAVANLCRHNHVHPEMALKSAIQKFASRFRHMETEIKNGKADSFADMTAADMDHLWLESKKKGL